jgi:hypothetical protein
LLIEAGTNHKLPQLHKDITIDDLDPSCEELSNSRLETSVALPSSVIIDMAFKHDGKFLTHTEQFTINPDVAFDNFRNEMINAVSDSFPSAKLTSIKLHWNWGKRVLVQTTTKKTPVEYSSLFREAHWTAVQSTIRDSASKKGGLLNMVLRVCAEFEKRAANADNELNGEEVRDVEVVEMEYASAGYARVRSFLTKMLTLIRAQQLINSMHCQELLSPTIHVISKNCKTTGDVWSATSKDPAIAISKRSPVSIKFITLAWIQLCSPFGRRLWLTS